MRTRGRRVEEFPLDAVGTWRLPYLVAGWMVDFFNGDPNKVFIQESEDPNYTLARDAVRQNKGQSYDEDRQIYIVNTLAQAGLILKIVCLARGESAESGLQAGSLTDSGGTVINPATADNQDELLDSFGTRAADPVANTLQDRLKGLSARVGEVQENPTQYTLLNRIKTLVSSVQSLFNNQGALVWGTKTAPTETAEAIGASQAIPHGIGVVVKAHSVNTDAVCVGGSGVTTANGFPLSAGESVTLYVINLNQIYVICGAASQVVRYIVEVAP